MTIGYTSAGKKFRDALKASQPLQIVGTINAYSAMMAKKIGHQAIYLSGGGVANASYGLPDLGMTSLNDVIADVQRITSACDLPLMVDIDTGWGGAFNIAKTVRDMEKAGAAAVHMEDQVAQKRCGHRPNKEIVSTDQSSHVATHYVSVEFIGANEQPEVIKTGKSKDVHNFFS